VHLQSQERRPFRLIGIGATSLVELAATNQIVAELYYCFAMTQIGCQPLSQRPDDIEPLFRHYLQKACLRLNHPVPEVDGELLKGMRRRVWLSNVRELANAAELLPLGYCHWLKPRIRNCICLNRHRSIVGSTSTSGRSLLKR
jgi:two-component system phosphoglycerate transport system response regulator PgtA